MTFASQHPEFTIVQQNKPKYRSLLPADSACAKAALTARIGRSNERDRVPFPSAPVIAQKEFPICDSRQRPITKPSLPMSPPLTPHTPVQAEFDERINSPTERQAASPVPARPTVPPSPYDPTATPTFRHSPPTLPWDQPWRFPSPSHPLHSRARELSLSMLTAVMASPSAKDPRSSPSIMTSSPNASSSVVAATDHLCKAMGSSPKTLFSKRELSVSCIDRIYSERHRRRTQESPLSRGDRRKHSLKPGSEVTDEYLSDAPLTSSPGLVRSASEGLLDTSIPLDVQDPFGNIYLDAGLSNDSTQDSTSPPGSSPGIDSPVLRSNTLTSDDTTDKSKPASVGLGIGLLEPFGFFGGHVESGFYGLVFPSDGSELQEESEVEAALASMAHGSHEYTGGCDTSSPSHKRRRTIDNIS
jgi:hypothetical protein